MTRRNLWRLAATILLAVCLSPLAAWIYSRVETAREIAYFRQFEEPDAGRGSWLGMPPVVFSVHTNWLLPLEQTSAWIPDVVEPHLLPLFEQPIGLFIPLSSLERPEAQDASRDTKVLDLRRVWRLNSLETLCIGDPNHLEQTGPANSSKLEIELANLKHLRSLRSLVIADVRVDNAAARSIEGLISLNHLGMCQTSLTDSRLVPIGNLRQLKNLSIAANPITDQGIAALSGLVNLERLDLSGTQVTRGCIPHLKGMTQLQWLSTPPIELIDDDLAILSTMRLTHLGVTSPHVTDAGLAHVARMSHLESLNIKATKVTAEGLKSLQSLTSLQLISLPKTRGIGQGLKYLRGCPLTVLNIPSRVITDADLPDLVWFIPRLDQKHLDLSNSRVSDAGMPALARLANCEMVDLENTQVTDAGLEPLTRIPGLLRIRLRGARVTGAGLRTLSQIAKLEELWLGKTQVDDAGLAELSKLPDLRDLDLQTTRVTDAGIEHLLECKKLTRVNLADTNLTDSGYLKLAAMPNLRWVGVDDTWVTPKGRNEFSARKAANKKAAELHE